MCHMCPSWKKKRWKKAIRQMEIHYRVLSELRKGKAAGAKCAASVECLAKAHQVGRRKATVHVYREIVVFKGLIDSLKVDDTHQTQRNRWAGLKLWIMWTKIFQISLWWDGLMGRPQSTDPSTKPLFVWKQTTRAMLRQSGEDECHKNIAFVANNMRGSWWKSDVGTYGPCGRARLKTVASRCCPKEGCTLKLH